MDLPGSTGQRLRLWSRQLLILQALFFVFGVTNAFLGPSLSLLYIHELRASPQIQALMGVITGIAWNMRMVIAMLSDSYPLCGYHRKAYLQLGLLLYSAAYVAPATLPASIGLTSILLFVATFGEMSTGVIMDTIMVEEIKFESGEERGTLQTHCQMLLVIGGVVGTLVGGQACEHWLSYKEMFVVNAAAKIPSFLCSFILQESRERSNSVLSETSTHIHRHLPSSASGTHLEQAAQRSKMSQVWEATKMRGIWHPGIFVFLFGSLPQAGDNVIVDFSKTLLGFPLLVLVASMTRQGVEGSTYAVVTSIQDTGGTVSGVVSAYIITGLGITLNDFENLWILIVICSLARFIALPFIPLLPGVKLVDTSDTFILDVDQDAGQVSKSMHFPSSEGEYLAVEQKFDSNNEGTKIPEIESGSSIPAHAKGDEQMDSWQGFGSQEGETKGSSLRVRLCATEISVKSTATSMQNALLETKSWWGGAALSFLLLGSISFSISMAVKDVIIAGS